jgi:cell division protein FtsB
VKNDLVARFQYVIGPVIAVSLLVYFVYHLIQGERGLLAWGRLKQQITVAEQKLHAVKTEQQALEQRVHLMRPDSLDTDMLEEQAKEKLNFVRKDEIIIKDDELGG